MVDPLAVARAVNHFTRIENFTRIERPALGRRCGASARLPWI